MRMHSVLAATILLAVSSGAAMAQGAASAGADCCTIPGAGKDNDNNPSVWGVTPEAGNAYGSANVHHPDMLRENSWMATAPVSGTRGRQARRHRAAPSGYASR